MGPHGHRPERRAGWSHNCNISRCATPDPYSNCTMKLLHLRVVLAAIDFDESSSDVLRGAHELAGAAGARLHVVNVATTGDAKHRTSLVGEDERRNALARILEDTGLTGSEVSLHLLAGDSVHAIRTLADRIGADVIVLGRHRARRAGTLALGSTALGVVTNSWAPCLILSQGIRLPLERVLVPIDLSDTSRGALVTALAWASALRGAKNIGAGATDETVDLRALIVTRPRLVADGAANQADKLDDELNTLRGEAGTWARVDIAGVLRSGDDVIASIVDYASENPPDLIVLGTRGLGLDGVGRLGSVSLEVARRLVVPILLVPPAVWRMYSAAR